MSTTKIVMSANGGPLTANVSCPKFPQSIVGIIWRYNADETFDKKMGTFKTDSPDVDFGSPADNSGKLFLIEGTVINQNDDPPTPYSVTVTLNQDGHELSSEVPEDGGSGKISNKDVAFVYHFTLVTA